MQTPGVGHALRLFTQYGENYSTLVYFYSKLKNKEK